MRGLIPWTGLTAMKREMDRGFDRFRGGDAVGLPAFGRRSPRRAARLRLHHGR
jgi:hypothetical protein